MALRLFLGTQKNNQKSPLVLVEVVMVVAITTVCLSSLLLFLVSKLIDACAHLKL